MGIWNAHTYLPYAIRWLEALTLLIVGIRLVRWSSRALEGVLVRRRIDQLLAEFLRTALTSLGVVVLALAALQVVGVPTTSFLAVLGTAGLAIGLALKDSLAHLAAGVMLIVLRPFRAGDAVRVAGQDGAVVHVGLFQTTLRSADNRELVLPNATITAQAIVNLSRYPTRRSDTVVMLALDAPLQQAVSSASAILAADLRVLREPAPLVTLAALSDRGAALSLQYWTAAADIDAVRTGVLTALAQELPARGCALVGPGGAAPSMPPPAPAPIAT